MVNEQKEGEEDSVPDPVNIHWCSLTQFIQYYTQAFPSSSSVCHARAPPGF